MQDSPLKRRNVLKLAAGAMVLALFPLLISCRESTGDTVGSCVPVRPDAGACGTAHCEMLAAGVSPPTSIAVNSTYVYWTGSDGTVNEIMPMGGTARIVFLGPENPGGIAASATSACWLVPCPPFTLFCGDSISCTPVGGASSRRPSLNANDVAVDSTDIYWTVILGVCASSLDAGVAGIVEMGRPVFAVGAEAGSSSYGGAVLFGDGGVLATNDTDASFVWSLCPGMVMKMPLAGGTPTVLASESNDDGVLGQIAVDESNVYWATDHGTLSKVAKTGGPVTVLATGLDTIGDMQTDGTNVYWIDGTPNPQLKGAGNYIDGQIMAVSVDGGTPTVLVSDQKALSGIAVDGTNVYWNTGDTGASCNLGSIMKVSVQGGTPTVLASGQALPIDIAVDDTSVYWTNGAQWIGGTSGPDIDYLDTTTGAVMRRTPK